jgi:type IV pilus assembly protein PilB
MTHAEADGRDIGTAEDLASAIFGQAIREQASDIHIDPVQDGGRVRFRIDGALHERLTLPVYKLGPFINRLKVLANLDISTRVEPQDSSFELEVLLPKTAKEPEEKKLVAARMSVFMTVNGEAVVLRLLNRSEMLISLDESDMVPEMLTRARRLIHKSYGMVLVTGPTGSGKTTTLYAALKEVMGTDKNIITLEDPVEYRFDGMRQVQMIPDQGLTFATGMKSILRQDPDIIMIGEIRDPETAEYAIRASLVGRLVFSTVHANTGVGTIARLIDMNIERSLIAYAINGVISKRLVKRICGNCAESYSPDQNALRYFGLDAAPQELKRGKGCATCNNTGHKGRVGIFEVLEFDAGIRSLIMEKAPLTALEEYVEKSGMTTLKQDALNKALAGLITIEDAARTV